MHRNFIEIQQKVKTKRFKDHLKGCKPIFFTFFQRVGWNEAEKRRDIPKV